MQDTGVGNREHMQRDRLRDIGLASTACWYHVAPPLGQWQRGTPVPSTSADCSMTQQYVSLPGLCVQKCLRAKDHLVYQGRSSSRAGPSPAEDDGRPDHPKKSKRPTVAKGSKGRTRRTPRPGVSAACLGCLSRQLYCSFCTRHTNIPVPTLTPPHADVQPEVELNVHHTERVEQVDVSAELLPDWQHPHGASCYVKTGHIFKLPFAQFRAELRKFTVARPMHRTSSSRPFSTRSRTGCSGRLQRKLSCLSFRSRQSPARHRQDTNPRSHSMEVVRFFSWRTARSYTDSVLREVALSVYSLSFLSFSARVAQAYVAPRTTWITHI